MIRSIVSLLMLLYVLIAPANAAIRGAPVQQEDTCKRRGTSCLESSDCCRGACQANICSPCLKLNQACTTSEECCGKKVCSLAGFCVKEDTDGTLTTDMTSWPETVGKTGEDAKAIILASNPKLYVEIILDGTPVTMDWRDDRVRVVVNTSGIVLYVPTIG